MSRDEELGHLSVMVTPGGVLVREYLKDLPADAEEHETYAEFTDNSWLVVWQVWAAFGMEFRPATATHNTAITAPLTPEERAAVSDGYYTLFVREEKEWMPPENLPLAAAEEADGLDAMEWEQFVHRVKKQGKPVTLDDIMALESEGSDECTLAMMNQDFVTKHYELVRFVDPDMFPGHSRESLIEIVPDMLEPLINS